MFEAKVVLDTLAPNGRRLTTMSWKYPRFIHAEILTHRDRARNSASSRAIPWPAMMARIEENPVVPLRWGSEKSGMQTGGEIENPAAATSVWLEARDNALRSAQALAELGVHKSLVNRITEPWMWIEVVMTATDWQNLWRQRCHPDAEIHFQEIAGMARAAYEASTPREPLETIIAGYDDGYGKGYEERTILSHLPYVVGAPDEDQLIGSELSLNELMRISTARCARVSYLTHEGTREPQKDLVLFERLATGSGFGHWSPMEHPATAHDNPNHRSGPFRGWQQFRKEFAMECADEPRDPVQSVLPAGV
jgi:hypothetical protein